MNTSRRGFFTALSAAAVGLAVDPELLAWEPGTRTFFDLRQQFHIAPGAEQLGISIRLIRNYDIAKDLYPHRFTALYGYGWPAIEDPLAAMVKMVNEPMPSAQLMMRPEEMIARQIAASEGFVMTETISRAEFKHRYGLDMPALAVKAGA